MTTRVLWGVALASALLLAVGARLDVGTNDTAAMPVLVAKQLIPERTPGERVFARMYDRKTVPLEQVEDGAIATPWFLCGRVTVTDVFPGEQLTAASFRSRLPGSGDRLPCGSSR